MKAPVKVREDLLYFSAFYADFLSLPQISDYMYHPLNSCWNLQILVACAENTRNRKI